MNAHSGVLLLVLVAMAVGGCATRDTPGAGHGADYTPVIDLQGVNRDVYATDLDACRRMARSIDANQQSMEGAIAGAFIGALVSGALGGGRQTTIDSANIGAMSGMGRAGGDALSGQKRIVINCMVGRGYRALEVTPALGSYQQPTASYDQTYLTEVDLRTLAGTWAGTGASKDGFTGGQLQIAVDGTFSGSTPLCSVVGSLKPVKAGKHPLETVASFSGAACPLGGMTITGIAVVSEASGRRQILTVGIADDQSDGFFGLLARQ